MRTYTGATYFKIILLHYNPSLNRSHYTTADHISSEILNLNLKIVLLPHRQNLNTKLKAQQVNLYIYSPSHTQLQCMSVHRVLCSCPVHDVALVKTNIETEEKHFLYKDKAMTVTANVRLILQTLQRSNESCW